MKKLFKFQLIFSLLALFFLASCGDDDSPAADEEEIAIDNPDDITGALTLDGATLNTGTPPAPSTDAAAPVLDTNTDDLTTISGAELIIPIDELNSSNIAGVYLQVEGASEYYDIPASQLGITSGRILGRQKRSSRTQEEELALFVGIPDNLSPGEFCVEYCVYDQENRVSNIVEVCITVLSFGGEGSAFLTANSWEMVSQYQKEEFGDEVYEEELEAGVTLEETFTHTIFCQNETEQQVEVTELSRIDYIYVTFSEEGGIQIMSSEYEKELDYFNTTCESGVVYEEGTETETIEGAWSFDDDNSELTLVTREEEEGPDGGTIEEDFVEVFDVRLDNGNLILSNEEGTEGSGNYYFFEIVFQPRN